MFKVYKWLSGYVWWQQIDIVNTGESSVIEAAILATFFYYASVIMRSCENSIRAAINITQKRIMPYDLCH